jgi:hypothetical protein
MMSNSLLFAIGLVVSVPTIIMVSVLIYANREDAKERRRTRGEQLPGLTP